MQIGVLDDGEAERPALEPAELASGGELLLSATYTPATPLLTTGALLVEGTDLCDVRLTRSVRLIGNVNAPLQPPPSGYTGPALDDGERGWSGSTLFGGLPSDARRLLAAEPTSLDEDRWHVSLPAGYGLEVLLIKLNARADLQVVELDDGDNIIATHRSEREGLSPEAVSLPPSLVDRQLRVEVVAAPGGRPDVAGVRTLTIHAVSAPVCRASRRARVRQRAAP